MMSLMEVKVPDIGDFKDVPIIEIQVKPGDVVKADDPLITLESDKATMEVPAPSEGKVVQVLVKIGDKVSEGSPIVKLEAGEQPVRAPSVLAQQEPELEKPARAKEGSRAKASGAVVSGGLPAPLSLDFGGVHASPSVRRIARELDIDLTKLKGNGEKGRITKDDVKSALRGSSRPSAGPAGGMGIPEIPAQDFSKFGPIEMKALSRIRKLSGPFLHRSWLNVPHVTHTDEADITDLEPYRKTLDSAAKDKGYRVTMLAFLMKASVVALKEHPEFNSSLSPAKDSLIIKKYYHLGVAVDTADGLVVPVIQNVDRKGILELSQELGTVSKKMRDGKIAPTDIQGASFTISSLGGIGGTNFTPIVNAPEVAILGVVRSTMKPAWDGEAFQPRLMLPLCVSYDHRVIDGALAARFTRRLASILEDVRQLVL
jgi:pyruvate dehydrogenase E2 component (dihydrolipoamide acetyltransferase)